MWLMICDEFWLKQNVYVECAMIWNSLENDEPYMNSLSRICDNKWIVVWFKY